MKIDPSQQIRVAVVGGGAFGEMHLRTLASMPQVEIAGLFTLEAERSAALVAQYGGRSYGSLEELAGDQSLDLVTIATPEDRHLEPFRTIAAHGHAIYLEKPLATRLGEAREILELSRDIVAMSGHCLRFEPRLARVFSELKGVPKHHLSFRDRRTRREKEVYGRVHPAFAMLCHEIELSNAFAECPFRRVMAMETRFSPGQVDGITILIEYENGLTSQVEGGWYLPTQNSVMDNDGVSIVSAQGVYEIAIPDTGYLRLGAGGLESPNMHYGHAVYGVEYGPLRSAFDYMIACLRQGVKPTISTIHDAYCAVELIEAALRSAAEGRWVMRSENLS